MRPIFAVYDTETTGLTVHKDSDLSRQPKMIEFGGILTDGIEIIGELEFICNPEVGIEEIITRITGLTNADLVDKPPFSHFVPQLKDYFGQADAAVAHNLAFDKNIVTYDLRRLGLELKDVSFPKIHICTVEQTFPFYGRRMKLIELYEMHCGTYIQKHRALDDVKLLHELCQKLGVYDAISTTSD